ncbi:YTH domain-containing protein ECT1-like isoform X2 [Salvia miltiorrhiza]|nr:YTH domain-containing protein ECT1-like isoform X2 [Salvia miltiorrhiza]XP_057780296.1 YTH domain-containing protein ECT1-like isoform X2 [Salvia miltiorrhiza]
MNIPDKDMVKDGLPSESVSSVSAGANAASGKGATDQPVTSEQGAYYSPTNCYDYYYPGYNGNFTQSDDKGFPNTPGGSYAGIQQDNSSLLYYVPSYGPYSTGFVGVDGKQAYTSSEYLQQPCSYGSEAFPCYTYDLAYAGNGSSSNKSGSVKSAGTSGSGRSNGFNVAKTNNNLSSKSSALPYNSRTQQPNSSRSIYQNQSLHPLSKLGTGFQSSGLMRGIQPAGNYSSFTSRNSRSFSQYGQVNYQSNGGLWNNNYRSRSRENFGRSGEIKAASELTRGPRADNRNSYKVPAEVEQLGFAIERDKYNLQEFETVYDSAKFFVIKSYSEDDIHKCIKYDVWSSTPNGNKKLDASFREADAKTSEAGKKCPVFLFFSVNGSGQFVGVAEMIGQVDFSKNMDFWQLDKWNGFFPLKWHIIKDVPNTQLRHIILENNENKAVTYSRDTQEIELKPGLEILSIFKNYSAKTCVLDDFNFYENREKALKAKRGGVAASQTNSFSNGDYEKHIEAGESVKKNQSDSSSLVALTKNLSLEPQPLQSSI